jgi:hypothetical protein
MNGACCIAVRDCGKYLPKIFENLNSLGSLFKKFHLIFVYDNCVDDTESLLYSYKQNSSFFVYIHHNIGNCSSYRTVRIASSRNKALDVLNTLENIHFHFVIDADDVNILTWNIPLIREYLSRNDWDSLSFNRNPYYDTWALYYHNYKHHSWGYGKNSIHVDNFYRNDISRKLSELKDHELFECHSAFNGFAIYRTEKFENIYYDGTYENIKLLISDEERNKTLNSLRHIPHIYIDEEYKEHCEHLYYHVCAIQFNNARIKICKHSIYL